VKIEADKWTNKNKVLELWFVCSLTLFNSLIKPIFNKISNSLIIAICLSAIQLIHLKVFKMPNGNLGIFKMIKLSHPGQL